MKSIDIGFSISEVNCLVHVRAAHKIRERVLFETWDKISEQLEGPVNGARTIDGMSRWWLPEWKNEKFQE